MNSPATMTLTLRPVTPDAVPADIPLSRLLAALQQHSARALGPGTEYNGPLDGAGRPASALTALALAAALTERITAPRWRMVEVALRAGAGVDAVAAAMGLEPVEVRAGFLSVVARREALSDVPDGLTPFEADALRALLDGQRR